MALAPLGSDWSPRIERALGELGVEPPPGAPLAELLDLVATWGRRIDLTAARSADELVDLMLADAAALVAASPPAGAWVDVGSGVGAPGLTLALLAPGVDITLVEPRAKRVAFLRTAVGVLAASNARVARARSDALAGGSFDVAVSRATLPPPEWLCEGARLAPAVWVLLARGAAPQLAGFRADVDFGYRWPLTGVERRALRYVAEP